MKITPYARPTVIALIATMTFTAAQASMMARNHPSRPTKPNPCAQIACAKKGSTPPGATLGPTKNAGDGNLK
ncbi:MAG: hypothetical protein ACYCXG_11125 [Acidiferrobacter sp.]